jgi:hypothetical protein
MTEPQTVLAAEIATAIATTCTVGDVLGFPASGAFTVRIGSERIRVGAGAATTSWSSLTRGYQQTTAAAHAAGAAVTLVPDLITTAGDADANSYLSVADADALAADDLGPEAEAWLAATAAVKEAALKRATREVDAYLREGYPETTAPLLFPRGVDVDDDDEPFIPRSVVLATYQQAIYLVKNAKALAAANTRRAHGNQSASEPNLSYTLDDGMPTLSAHAALYIARMRSMVRGIASVRLVLVEPE